MEQSDGGPPPAFSRPPVIEVAIGVEFLQLPALSTVPLVELRYLWANDYPRVEEQPAAPRSRPGPPGVNLEFLPGVPPLRLWLLTTTGDELVQLQNDRLILNWRQTREEPYPHYEALRPKFIDSWEKFSAAVTERSLGELRPITAEVTYVNRITPEHGESLFDILSILPPGGPLQKSGLHLQLDVALSDHDSAGINGRQTIVASRSTADTIDISVATKFDIGQEGVAIVEALNNAHAAGVNSFVEVTSAKMHDRWGRVS